MKGLICKFESLFMDILLNNNSSQPIYNQIYSQIKSQIITGKLKAGTQLPPIRTISLNLKISVIPVKMAWEMLDNDGFIHTITGKGTFVANISNEHIKTKIEDDTLKIAKETAQKLKTLGINVDNFVNYLKNELSN